MREKNHQQIGKESMSGRHPIRQQLLAVLLGLCLAVVSIPVSQIGYSVQAAERLEYSENIDLSREASGQESLKYNRNLGKVPVTSDNGKTDKSGGKQENSGKKKNIQKVKTLEEETAAVFADDSGLSETPKVPGCGIVSEDVTWEVLGTLTDGELIVMPGVTLTITQPVIIGGSVTIKGGGTIARGGSGAGFIMNGGGNLVLEDITLDGCSSEFPAAVTSMITAKGRNTIRMESGCAIRNCSSTSAGAAISLPLGNGENSDIIINGALIENCQTAGVGGAISADSKSTKSGSITLNNATIRNCTAGTTGGGIYAPDIDVTINGGHYENNKTTKLSGGYVGGGFISICRSTLIIKDGIFTGNSCVNKGGCVSHCGHLNTRTYIYGGTFSGNTCSSKQYAGSGALYNATVDAADTSVTLSGNVKFIGNTDNSGTDGIYLDAKGGATCKIQISDTLTYPIKVYLNPLEGYVIAQGVNDYQLLGKRDMKKITFVDVTDSGKTWYAALNETANQVYISEINPAYAYFVYYIKNGAQGTAVADDNEYELGDTVTVKSAEGLSYEGRRFVGWNTEPDGSGVMYQENDTFDLEGDTNLYAIFEEGITADFYSGSAGNKQTVAADMDLEQNTGIVTTPELLPLEGFTAVGWAESHEAFDGEIAERTELILTANASYYGVYEKEVVLSYNVNGGETCPESETQICRANVGEEISYDTPVFTVAEEATKTGGAFLGWNTKADGSGTMYRQGDALEIVQDQELYAIFEDRPLFYADFYSGNAGDKERVITLLEEGAVSGMVLAPELKPMNDFKALGWSGSHEGYHAEAVAGDELTLTANAAYYGVYEKEVVLSYDANGGDVCPESETGICRANVGMEDISYDRPAFTAAGALPRQGYVFAGWNTRQDGKGEPYLAGEDLELDHDTALYAMWVAGDCTPYRVEHYWQDIEGDSYTRVDADTEYIAGRTGDTVKAQANPYTGFRRNLELGRAEGVVEGDGSLALQVYYDRDLYEVGFDLNGGEGAAPQTQTVRYGGRLQEAPQPQRRGYTFKGWYLNREGTDDAYWDFCQTVEENSGERKAMLYAKWVDETAPVLGEAEFGEGSANFMDWAIGKKKLTITVPVTEEGSGLSQGDYSLKPEGGKLQSGTAVIRVYQSITPELRARSGGLTAALTVRGNARTGQSVAVITIAEEFKGSVTLTCTDNAGNVSAEKVLTADGAGAIVEDNAPDIRFSKEGDGAAEGRTAVAVDVADSAGGNVTAGLKSVTYRLDGGRERSVGREEFTDSMVESYHFAVDIREEGKHTLEVTAADNAGNSATRKASVEISRKKAAVTPTPQGPTKTETPKSPTGEPVTGENTFVKVFATLGMVAGFTYLLLYFTGGEGGITEGEKEEVIARLVRWAHRGKFRKYPALVIILLFLLYYHSIGRSVGDDWKKVYEG